MATTNNFANIPKTAVVNFSTANTNRDGTGTIATLFTAGSSGSRIERITVHARGTTTAGAVRFYLHDGTTAFLYQEMDVPAITPSATLEAFHGVISFGGSAYSLTAGAASTTIIIPGIGLILPNGWSLRVSTHNADSFNAFAEGGDF